MNPVEIAKSLQLDTGGLMMGSDVLGGLSNDTFARLQKALIASPSTPGGPGDGSSLIPQSLARTLKNVTFKTRNVKFWRSIPKQDAYAMEEEFDQLTAYGQRGGVFTSAMATPQGNDSTFGRVQVAMKYMATAYATDIAIMATEVIGGSAEALQINNATRFLLGGIERQLFYADSSLLPTAFDGMKTIIQNFATSNGFTNVIVNAGAAGITPDTLENALQAIQDNAGDPSNGMYSIYMAPRVRSYFTKTYLSAQRTEIDRSREAKGDGLWIGTPVKGYSGTYGDLPMIDDIFLNQDVPITTAIQGAPAVPTLPTTSLALNTTTGEDPNLATSMWQTPVNASDYGVGYNGGPVTYALEAVNASGPSQLSAASNSITVGEGESTTFTWNRITTSPSANYYQIYRAMNGGAWQPVARVKDAGTGATQAWTDENITVAGAYDAFIINRDPEEGAVFKQLLPFFKWPLPIPALARYFAVALLGAPLIFVPSRCAVIENIQIPGGLAAPVQLS